MSHYVDALETIYCTNCGVSSTTETCKRCMEMTQCPSCKRRLPSYCYFAGSDSLCEVRRVANITVVIDVVVAAVAAAVVVFYECVCCNTFVQHVFTSSMILHTHIHTNTISVRRVAELHEKTIPTTYQKRSGWCPDRDRISSYKDRYIARKVHPSKPSRNSAIGGWILVSTWVLFVCLFVCFGVYG